jgi:hypothetical protein
MLKTLVENLNLVMYYDYVGYNVLEIPYNDYLNCYVEVGSLLTSYPGLGILTIDDYGNIIGKEDEVENYDNLLVIVYEIKVWEENGML